MHMARRSKGEEWEAKYEALAERHTRELQALEDKLTQERKRARDLQEAHENELLRHMAEIGKERQNSDGEKAVSSSLKELVKIREGKLKLEQNAAQRLREAVMELRQNVAELNGGLAEKDRELERIRDAARKSEASLKDDLENATATADRLRESLADIEEEVLRLRDAARRTEASLREELRDCKDAWAKERSELVAQHRDMERALGEGYAAERLAMSDR